MAYETDGEKAVRLLRQVPGPAYVLGVVIVMAFVACMWILSSCVMEEDRMNKGYPLKDGTLPVQVDE